MDVWQITVAALRRWYVLLPMLALTVLLALAAGKGVKEEYVATGTLMVVPGRMIPNAPNPYGGPDDANNAVAIVLNSPEARRQVAEQGLASDYEVLPQSRSTIMAFTVRSESPSVSVDTGAAVFDLAAEELRDRQAAAGIRTGSQYSVDALQPPSLSEVVTEGKRRNIAVVGVLGAGVSLVVAVFLDDVVGLVRRRRRRQRGTKGLDAGVPGADETTSDTLVDSDDIAETPAVGGAR